MPLRALIWDVDGTIAETERDGHRVAFNRAFAAHDLRWHWDVPTYDRLLKVTGGRERLLHAMEARADAPSSHDARVDLARRLHATKNAIYASLVASGGIEWRPGVRRLMETCEAAGVIQAIATTTSRSNVDALMAATLGPGWTSRFGAIVCAEDAPSKKPDPQAYRIALDRLSIEAPDAVAVEDSPNGLAAALALGIAVVVTRSDSFREAAFAGAAAICDDLDSPVTWVGGPTPRVDLALLQALVGPTGD